ncbi:MAG: thermonuclease family protein [Phycisphaerae bacterium]|nr:thermonuclease family protein [Phycisphaerae bacterium]
MTRYRRKSSSRSARHGMRYTRRRALGYLAAVLIATGMILADRMGVFGWRPEPRAKRYNPDAAAIARNNASDLRTYHNKSFEVTYVVDGDTLDVGAGDKVRGKDVTRIRLWGVDTPETVKPDTPEQHFGREASAFTKDTCMGKTVRLELVANRNTRDKYGRLLAYVLTPSTGADGNPTCLNAELISQGYGYCDPRYAHPRKTEFRALQQQARGNKLGLWAGVSDKDLPHYYRGKIKLGQ